MSTVDGRMSENVVNVTPCRESDTLLRVIDDHANTAIIVRVGDSEATISHSDAGALVLSLFKIICQ